MAEIEIGGVRLRLDPSESRFWRAFGAWLLFLAGATGVATTLVTAHALSSFGQLEQVPSVIALRNIRELGPSAVSSAALFALITWGHFMSEKLLAARWHRGVVRASLAAVVGLPVAWLSVAVASFATTRAAYALSWQKCWSAANRFLGPIDFAIGGAILAAELAAIFLLSFGSLPRLARSRCPLPLKIGLAWIVLLLLRAAVTALVTSVFPVPRL
jgi:hypothetical protein